MKNQTTKNLIKNFTAPLRDQTGAALMMALFTIVMLWIIATEIMYETNVEFAVSAQAVNQVRAHYAAKSGIEIGLLRLHIYQKVMASMGDAAKSLPILDMIWQMPFSWPPLVPSETNTVDKEQIKTSVKASIMQGQYLSTIESESGKIDLSLLASENQDLVKLTTDQLKQVFQDEVQSDEKFAKVHGNDDFGKIVNNLKDWVDADDKSDNGGEEKAMYPDFGKNEQIPPNQPFKTFEELHMVAGLTDDLYNVLIGKVTIYGASAINVKYASKGVLAAAFGLTEDQAGRLLTERSKDDTQILKDEKSFLGFIESLGVRHEALYDSKTNQSKIHILVEPEFNFRVKSIGTSGKVQRTITVIVFDYNRVLAQLRTYAPPATPTPQPGAGSGVAPTLPAPTPTPNASPTPQPNQVPNDRPNIVYWNES